MSELALAMQHRFSDFALDLELEIPLSGVTALLGHSGAGKSTVLAVLAGIFSPQEGRLTIADDVLLDTTLGVQVPPEARHFGCVLQRPLLFPHMTVEHNLAFGADRQREPMVVQEFASVVRLLELQALLGRFPRHLSGGEQQRVALARALLSRPRLLLLDEPLAAVDPARRHDVLPYLERLCEEGGVPVVYVSHSVNDVARLADRIIVLDQGRVRAVGPVHEVLSGEDAFGAEDIINVVEGRLSEHPDDARLASLDFGDGKIVLPMPTQGAGRRSRCVLRAQDIVLSVAPLPAVSAHNVLPVNVVDLTDEANGSTRVSLACGETRLTSRVTQASVRRLGLAQGMTVYAVFKAEHLRGDAT